MAPSLPAQQNHSFAQVLGRRFVWGLGIGALLLAQTLAIVFVSVLVLALSLHASSKEPGMLGITLLDVICCIGAVVALEMAIVGFASGFVVAGFAHRGITQTSAKFDWQRILKHSAIWGLVGVLSAPLWVMLIVFVDANNFVFGPLFSPLVTVAGLTMSLRKMCRVDGQPG